MNSRARARSGFSTNCAMGATAPLARAAADVAVAGLGRARHDAEGHQLAGGGRGHRQPDRRPGTPRDRAARDPRAAPACSASSPASWRAACAASAMAGAVLRPTGSSRMAAGGMPISRSCSATRKRCASLQTTIGRGGVRKPREPRGGVLDHGALAGQRQELLGQQLARQRPEARAGAAGEDHRDEFHGGGIVPVLIEWVINTRTQCYIPRMKNITITLDLDTAKWVRIKAAEQNKSVSRFVGELLQQQMKERLRISARDGAISCRSPRSSFVTPANHSPPAKSFMTALVFVDTNVLVYARETRDPVKRARAREWLEFLWRDLRGRTSIQVLNEYYAVLTQGTKHRVCS